MDKSFIDVHGQEIASHIHQNITEGLHFGTLKLKRAYQIANSKMLESAINKDIIPDVLLFDQLICNTDRDRNGGNLLFDPSEMKIVVIDHSHVFEIGSLWNSFQLRARLGSQFQPFMIDGYVFRKLVPFVKGNNPFNSIIVKMLRVTSDQLWNIINTIPYEWSISDDDKLALHEYLCDRLHRINDALPIMKPCLPLWKGGS